MCTKNIIVGLCLIISLLGLPTKVIAEPLEIEKYQDIKIYAFEVVLKTWGSEQWDAFDKLIKRESQWVHTAQNPSSTAYGLGQFLNSTWGLVDCEKTNNPNEQIDCTVKYVEKVYGTPQKALSFHIKNNWY